MQIEVVFYFLPMLTNNIQGIDVNRAAFFEDSPVLYKRNSLLSLKTNH